MFYLLALPLAVLAYFYYRSTVPEISSKRRILLLSLRIITLLILLLLTFNPILNFRRTVTFRPKIVLLRDNSYSMELPAGDKTKIELLETHLETLNQKASANNYELRSLSFADGIGGDRNRTSLTNTLRDLNSQIRLNEIEQVILVSDGWFSDENLDIINRLEIPIHTLHPEYISGDFTIGINNLYYNPTAYTEEENSIIADVFAEDYNDSALVKLYIEEELRAEQRVNFEESNYQQITFEHIFPQPGLYPIRVEISAVNGSSDNVDSSSLPGAIRVLDSRSGISIITDRLSWEGRFLNVSFIGDDRKEVRTFIKRDGTVKEGNSPLSFRETFISNLQLLILVNHQHLSFNNEEIELIERFVSNGGGLLFIGRPISELNDLTGMTHSGLDRLFRGTLTLTGDSDRYQTMQNIDVSSIPPVDYLYVNALLQAEVLARIQNDEQSPVIIHHQYGTGRVLSLPLFNLWRWQLRSPDNRFKSFFDQVATWLSNPVENTFFATTDKNSYMLGETVKLDLSAFDETLNIHRGLSPRLTLFRDDDEQLVLEDFLTFSGQTYQRSIENLAAGDYRYEINDQQTGESTEGHFIVSDIGLESRHRGFNFPLLSYVSRQTGGKPLFADDLADLNLTSAEMRRETRRFEIPLYRHWLLISLFLLSFLTELFFRRKWGLL